MWTTEWPEKPDQKEDFRGIRLGVTPMADDAPEIYRIEDPDPRGSFLTLRDPYPRDLFKEFCPDGIIRYSPNYIRTKELIAISGNCQEPKNED